ncbi:Uncharacterized protein FWK35_00012726 [Aphis craccivora]|uniref:Uncharacterized protein n=1 Tax=Aphis craccivora TaxID=307492 RepID=A0A6G0ZCJ2_APHCR|nr:Uncharacterized protein FWK35_00012726 [Aphis craccivora]
MDSERSDEYIDFTMIVTSQNNASISNFGGGFRWQSDYPWCIIEVKTFSNSFQKNREKQIKNVSINTFYEICRKREIVQIIENFTITVIAQFFFISFKLRVTVRMIILNLYYNLYTNMIFEEDSGNLSWFSLKQKKTKSDKRAFWYLCTF